MYEMFLGLLKAQDVKYLENVSIAQISPIRIGGIARAVIYPDDTETLVKVLKLLSENKIAYKIVGRMSNILPKDGYYDGVLIKTDKIRSYAFDNEYLFVESGATLTSVISECMARRMCGFEELVGIPGSIGGLIMTNAGAFGKEISDILCSVDLIDLSTHRRVMLCREDIDFSYRGCPLKGKYALLSAKIRLVPRADSEISTGIRYFRNLRMSTQPIGEMTLGSTFKRPKNGYAAKMIDECGLKGASIGGAEISRVHAGFIINSNNATCADVVALMGLCEREVLSRFGVRLEREIELM